MMLTECDTCGGYVSATRASSRRCWRCDMPQRKGGPLNDPTALLIDDDHERREQARRLEELRRKLREEAG